LSLILQVLNWQQGAAQNWWNTVALYSAACHMLKVSAVTVMCRQGKLDSVLKRTPTPSSPCLRELLPLLPALHALFMRYLQGVPNNYETDLIFPIVAKAAELAGIDYAAAPPAAQTALKVRLKGHEAGAMRMSLCSLMLQGTPAHHNVMSNSRQVIWCAALSLYCVSLRTGHWRPRACCGVPFV
jgi:hypothetical protein